MYICNEFDTDMMTLTIKATDMIILTKNTTKMMLRWLAGILGLMQPLLQAGVSLLHGLVVNGVGQRLGGAHEDAEAFGSRDAGIDQIALQHYEVGHQQGDDDHGILRALRLVDGGGVGHKASSTMSMYGSVSGRGVFDLLQATQQHRSERWFCANHFLSCRLSVNVSRFVTSIGKSFCHILLIPAK